MTALKTEIVEEEVIEIVKQICGILKIDATIDAECRPGDIIKSQVLLTAIGSIEDILGIKIPTDCYIFCSKDRKQLSIKETAAKIIKVAQYEQQK